ncbi:hypothetical protein PC129_g5793 [Phytophthora cactorum]|uniref:Uncharacterized protein n=1 Tax=Phytophthora cactorum TaxID=29920 RepID=A0A8T1DQB4_9STRA|nr:hypothetical protein PC111_g2893 [Phytophthora cactorum]KAG2934106.1 hypothetical protein PC114_g1170 [Phytophthora cactorum]KAG2943817.1 hypothetical protein PC115_g652 [Phytophthora cactorum]KAG3033016.1 hypothetical protein PC120_g2165 [Phytophthora cactorum]KAG3033727.1 hypothetical protein PC119_g5172 [Phytophthora cactorum]
MALYTYSGIGFGGEVTPNLEAISDALVIHGAHSVGQNAEKKASPAEAAPELAVLVPQTGSSGGSLCGDWSDCGGVMVNGVDELDALRGASSDDVAEDDDDVTAKDPQGDIQMDN